MQLSTNLAIKAIHRGANFTELDLIDDTEIELFNYYSDEHCDNIVLQHTLPIDHTERQQKWRYPAEYDELNLFEYFMDKCNTDIERERVVTELTLFCERDLLKLLRWAIWFMDYVRENNEFIGVGRGSSVASYCLYLIDLHMINSIECGLDPREFLK